MGLPGSERTSTGDKTHSGEECYRALFERAAIGIERIALDGRFIDVNAALCAMLGRTRDEFLATSAAAITHRDDLPQEQTLLRRLLAKEIESYVLEKRYLHRDGRAIWVKTTCALTGDPAAPDTCRISMVEDLTLGKQAQLAAKDRLEAEIAERERAERALRESEDAYRAFYRQAPMPQHTLDRESRIIDVSDRWIELLDYERTEVVGKPIASFMTETSAQLFAERWPAYVKIGKVRDRAIDFVKRSGEVVEALIFGRAEYDGAGNFVRDVGIIIDVTGRRQLERERDRHFELSRDMLVVAGFDGLLRHVNRAAIEACGMTREQLLTTRYIEFVHPDDRARTESCIERLAAGEPVVENELRIRYGDGTWHWTAWKATSDPSEGVIYGVGLDVHKQRRLERERDRYFELSRDLLVISNFDGAFLDVNRAVLEQTGRTREELLGTPMIEFVHPDDRAAVLSGYRRLVAGEPAVGHEFRLRWPDGTWHWTAWKAMPIPEERVIYGLGRDIQEQRETEESLRRAQRMEAIGQLTGGIAHDFNNLLTSIIGNLDLIVQRASPGDRQRRLAKAALQAAERGAELTQKLLAFGRRQPLSPKAVDVNDLLREMDIIYRRALGETVLLSLELQDGLWPCRVDPPQFETAILNLVLNARDALPQGGLVIISTEAAAVSPGQIPELAPGDYVRVTVQDNGTGMAPDVAAQAFEPFFTTKEVGKGSGLGLSMVYGFAKQSGGTARIDSVPGSGTAVRLYLPRSAAEPHRAVSPEAPSRGGAERRATILVVEDEDSVRQVTADILEEAGHHVLTARDASEALAVLRGAEAIDLLISDIVMPGDMSGIELGQEAQRLRPRQRVILITGYAAKRADEELRASGFEVMRKPYRPGELVTKVAEMLGQE
jgi:PAS domain S-box-containing protein